MSKYIKINLNQVVSRFQREEMELNRKRTYIALALSISFICLFSFMSYTNYKLNELINLRKAEIRKIESDIASLKKEGDIDLSKKDIEGLFSFESKRTYWIPKLQALADITSPKMAIAEIEFARGRLFITGITGIDENIKEFDIVEEFMNKMKEDDAFKNHFKDIRFVNSFTDQIQGQPTFTFKIQAKLNKKTKRRRK